MTTENQEIPEVGLVGEVIDTRYQIEEELGRGAMGVVYKARHVAIDRPVAIKVIHARLLRTPTMIERFEREAEIAAKLNHKNVVPVLDSGELADGRRSMVLEFVSGISLVDILAGPVDPERVVELLGQLCDGLDHAHNLGLVHRDLKPENVVIQRDEMGREVPRIIDFGIAILRDPKDSMIVVGKKLTDSNVVLGTPAYMAPEQATGKRVDRRTDLFALGVMAFEMLAGRLPFDGEGVDIALANVSQDMPKLSERAPNVKIDPLLEGIVRKLAARRPEDRFGTARAARQALDLLAKDREKLAALLGLPIAMAREKSPRRMLQTFESFEALDDDPRVPDPTPPTRIHAKRRLPWMEIVAGLVLVGAIAGILASI